MDFLDPKKKRAYNIRLFIGFVLTGIVLLLGTIVLALITSGFSINRHTGAVIQNGLVYINAQPQSASIYINGTLYGQTNARIELPEGQYNFDLRRTGYHDWTNTTQVQGGLIDELDYPFLFPLNPAITTATTVAAQPDLVTETPNQHYLLVSDPSDFGTFNVIDVTNPQAAITSFTIPSNVLTSEPGTNSFQLVHWSTDNQHVLLKHNYPGGSEYIMVDWTTPSNSFNASQDFSTTPFTDIRLDNNNYSKLYLYNAPTQTLSLGDAAAKTVTPVLSSVLAYWPYGNNEILYTTPIAGNTTNVMAKLYDSGKSYNIRELPVSSSYLLNIASFNGNSYVVMGDSNDQVGYIYENPLSEISGARPGALPVPYTIFVINGTPEQITFSTSAGYIEMQSSSQIAVYDIQAQTHFRYNIPVPIASGELANWMDGNRLTLVSNSKLSIFDFDGTNLVKYTNDNAGYLPAFNSAYNAVYTTNETSNGQWEINRTSLIATSSATS
jgi:hypothetical protein